MKLKPTLLALIASAGAALCGPACASPNVSYNYSGIVDSDDAERGWLTFTGQFSFDRTLPDQIADPSTADYKMSSWPNGMNVVFNDGSSFSFNDFFDILVTNNLGGSDQFGAQAQAAGAPDALGLTLYDFTQSVFASDALPLPADGLSLPMFGWSEFKYESAGGLLSGHLTSLSCAAGCDQAAAVPEPQSLALVLAALVALGAVRRRRSRPIGL